MDVAFELLGKDKVVISLKDFEDMLDLIAYDKAKENIKEIFPSEITRRILKGESKLKIFRQHRKLSQSELSEIANLPQGMISEIENHKKTGSIKALKRLATALDIEINQLI